MVLLHTIRRGAIHLPAGTAWVGEIPLYTFNLCVPERRINSDIEGQLLR